MKITIIRAEIETEDLLLSISKSCKMPIIQTQTKKH